MNGYFINEYILALKISFVQYLKLQYVLTPQTLKTKLENISLLSLSNIWLKANEAVQRAHIHKENKAFKFKIGCLIVH